MSLQCSRCLHVADCTDLDTSCVNVEVEDDQIRVSGTYEIHCDRCGSLVTTIGPRAARSLAKLFKRTDRSPGDASYEEVDEPEITPIEAVRSGHPHHPLFVFGISIAVTIEQTVERDDGSERSTRKRVVFPVKNAMGGFPARKDEDSLNERILKADKDNFETERRLASDFDPRSYFDR